MARKVIEILSSDLSGSQSDDVRTVQFSLDGRAYDIDLTPGERAELDSAVKVYVAKGRRAQIEAPKRKSVDDAAKRRADLQAARMWLRLRGHAVPERGRVKQTLLDEWAEHGKPGL